MGYNYFALYGQVLYYRGYHYGGLWLIDLGQLRILNYLVSPAAPEEPAGFVFLSVKDRR